jgi:hypothetical protein
MDTGNEELGVYTLINTYIPLGVIVPVCLSNKCLFFYFVPSEHQYTRPMSLYC